MKIALLAATISALILGTPAASKAVRMAGVPLGPCPAGVECGRGPMLRIPPWQISEYREIIGSSDKAEEPYVPLTPQEQAALSRLAEEILRKPPAADGKAAYASMSVQNSYVANPYQVPILRDSNLDELWSAIGKSCNASKVFSMTNKEDTSERYGLLDFECIDNGKKTHALVGVALHSDQPIRAYFGVPSPVYGKLSDGKDDQGKRPPAPNHHTTGPLITEWAACMSRYAEPRLATQSTEVIVDGAFLACAAREKAVRDAQMRDDPEAGGAVFEGVKHGSREIMMRRITQAKQQRGYR